MSSRIATAALAALALGVAAAGALDWPLESAAVLSTFGTSDGAGFAPGVELVGSARTVWPVADGEVIFSHEEGGYSTVPRAGGNMVALLHEGGIQSVYTHLAAPVTSARSVRARPRLLSRAELEQAAAEAGDAEAAALIRSSYEPRGDRLALRSDLDAAALGSLWAAMARTRTFAPLGVLGDSGAAEGPMLGLLLIDARERRFLNPLKPEKSPLAQPGGPQSPPIIEQVLLEREGERSLLANGMAVAPGNVELLVVTYDLVSAGRLSRRVAPYRLSLAQSGQILKEVKFESLEDSEGRLTVGSSGLRHEDLYADAWTYRLGRLALVEGRAHLELRVEDFSGASRTVDVQFRVEP